MIWKYVFFMFMLLLTEYFIFDKMFVYFLISILDSRHHIRGPMSQIHLVP